MASASGRTQYPITRAGSFTDYRVQGRTIPHVIDDIALSLTPELSLFDLLYLFLVAAMGMRELG